MTDNAQPSRPLPDVNDPLTAPFWAATAQRKLVVQACAECGYRRWPPGPLCPECQAEGGTWTQVRPAGVLWSVATYHRALDRAFGRQTMTTGMPVRSSPVRLATRVIPRTFLCARTRAIVSSAVKARIARGS